MKCVKCGSELKEGALFCNKCGAENLDNVENLNIEEFDKGYEKYLDKKANIEDFDEVVTRLNYGLQYAKRIESISAVQNSIDERETKKLMRLYESEYDKYTTALLVKRISIIAFIVSIFMLFVICNSKSYSGAGAYVFFIFLSIVTFFIALARLGSHEYALKAYLKGLNSEINIFNECIRIIKLYVDYSCDYSLQTSVREDSLENESIFFRGLEDDFSKMKDDYYEKMNNLLAIYNIRIHVLDGVLAEVNRNSKDILHILTIFDSLRTRSITEAINMMIYDDNEYRKIVALRGNTSALMEANNIIIENQNKQTSKLSEIKNLVESQNKGR